MFYFIFGVRKSGNHAIIGWLYGLLQKNYFHINNLREFSREKFIECWKTNYVNKNRGNVNL